MDVWLEDCYWHPVMNCWWLQTNISPWKAQQFWWWSEYFSFHTLAIWKRWKTNSQRIIQITVQCSIVHFLCQLAQSGNILHKRIDNGSIFCCLVWHCNKKNIVGVFAYGFLYSHVDWCPGLTLSFWILLTARRTVMVTKDDDGYCYVALKRSMVVVTSSPICD